MIAAVNFPSPLLSDMAIAPPGRDDDNRESLTSFELVLRAQAGDDRARDLLIGRYQTRLNRWAHGRLPLSARGGHETHDLVQDTLLQVLNNLHKFNPRHEGAFQGFVRIILANRIRDPARSGPAAASGIRSRATSCRGMACRRSTKRSAPRRGRVTRRLSAASGPRTASSSSRASRWGCPTRKWSRCFTSRACRP